MEQRLTVTGTVVCLISNRGNEQFSFSIHLTLTCMWFRTGSLANWTVGWRGTREARPRLFTVTIAVTTTVTVTDAVTITVVVYVACTIH